MEQKYKNSLVLGKFYPPHLGHIYLIDTALKQSEHVHLMVCHINSETILGDNRYKALSKHYEDNQNITIYNIDCSSLPQQEKDCETLDEFYSHWVSLVYSTIDSLDCVFTSEKYGDDFAKYLKIQHVLVDLECKTIPISGTMIRKEMLNWWHMMPSSTQMIFKKKIVILGTESTGKSTLVGKLGNYFNAAISEEYGREFAVAHGTNNLTTEDFNHIAYTHAERVDQTHMDSPSWVSIHDTEAITTKVFGELYLGDNFDSTFIDELIKQQHFDLYLLLDNDVPWINDGTREFKDLRGKHFNRLKDVLKNNKVDYQLVSGTYDDRYHKSIKIIEEIFAK